MTAAANQAWVEVWRIARAVDSWEETKHPRVKGGANAGQFGKGSGSGAAPKSSASVPAESGVTKAAVSTASKIPVASVPKSEFHLAPDQHKVETKFRDQLAGDWEGSKKEYREKHGTLLNADEAKEMSPEYRADRSRMAIAVHEPASFLIKAIYAEELAKPAPDGKTNTVFFTAGGAGSGKTSGIAEADHLEDDAVKSQIVYDGTLRPYDSAKKKVEQALDAGKAAKVAYVHRDPEDALMNGVVPRAERIGRTVPLDEFCRQHADIQNSMMKLQQNFGDKPNFKMTVVDNSQGKGNAKVSSFQDLPKAEPYEQMLPRLRAKLDAAYSDGKVSKKVYEGITQYGGAGKEIGV